MLALALSPGTDARGCCVPAFEAVLMWHASCLEQYQQAGGTASSAPAFSADMSGAAACMVGGVDLN